MIPRLMRFYATTLGVVSSSMISSWTPGASAFVASPYVPQSSTLWATTRCINNCKQHHRASSILHHRASGGLSRLSSSSSELPVAVEEGERRVDPKVTELPDSFEDSITRMGKATLQAMEEVCLSRGCWPQTCTSRTACVVTLRYGLALCVMALRG